MGRSRITLYITIHSSKTMSLGGILVAELRISSYGKYGAALFDASMLLFRQPNRADVVNVMFDFMEKRGRSPHLSLYLFEPAGAKMIAGRGLHEKLVGRIRDTQKGEFAEVLSTGQVRINRDYQNRRDRGLPLPSDLVFAKAHEQVRAALVLPFKSAERIIGAVGLDYEDAGQLPDAELLWLLEQYAVWAGVAYENARIFETQAQMLKGREQLQLQLEQRMAMLQFLHDASLAILQHRDIKELLEIIITKGAEFTKADGAYVFLPVENSNELERAVAIGAARESLGLRIRPGEGAAGRAWASNDMVVDNTYRASQCHLASCNEVEAVINFPLRREDTVVGIVGFWHVHAGEKFWENDVQAIRFLAQLSSLAYDNACLYDEAKHELVGRKQLEDEIRHMAYHDALTGLPNRRLLEDRLQQAITQARRFNERLAVMFLDLDSMKRINDSYGHEAGDILLESVAARLISVVREIDTVARISGDEFVLILPRQDNRNMADELADRILTAIRRPFDLGRAGSVEITASIGISFFPTDGTDDATLLRSADKAMYVAKQLGRDQWCFAQGNASKR